MPTDLSSDLSSFLPSPDAEQKRALKETHASFWVTASAGSGKTMLLTQRFLALLLDGAAPERILCLTYTRAAAAEMSTRIMEALKSCTEEGEVVRLYRAFFDRDPDEDEQQRALTLHTRSLDCKGGLRVMTFHAFCQSVLGKFPLESGIPPHFRLVEQGRKQQLGRDALFATTTSPQQLATINDFMPLETCAVCIGDIAARARSPKELARAKAVVARLFSRPQESTTPSETPPLAREIREILARLEQTLAQHRPKLKPSDVEKLQKLSAWLKSKDDEDYRNLFLTQKGLLPKRSLLTKETLALLPDDGTEQALQREAERLARVRREHERQHLRAINLALYTLAEESAKALEAKRRRQAVLDFDDLIDKTQELLASSQTPWVHYKLDGSFDHVLIDEAQDTNHAQWNIVEQLTEEIFSNPARNPAHNPTHNPSHNSSRNSSLWAKAERKPRSLFVVGDEKQSIYSFQGADLRHFTAAREKFRARASNANMPFRTPTLTFSYRSLAPVLEAVDQTFDTPEMLASLQALPPERLALDEDTSPRPLLHRAQRTEKGGSASLHLLALDKDASPPLSAAEEKTAWAQRIADFVAEQVLGEKATPPYEGSLGEGSLGEGSLSEGSKPRAGDVLLLLPQRTQLMLPLLAAFAERKLPCEDIDKFDLIATLQAEDVLAWLKFLVLPEDELNLASLLKTPFLALSEEALQALCLARCEQPQNLNLNLNLWHALSVSDELADVAAWLKHARARACDLSPFDALRFLLERPCPRATSGTAALLAVHRNLDPAENLCEEALAFAQSTTPATLSQFLEHLEGLQVAVKRESITQPTDKMRLMTIHGAKGLEAPIVVLPLFYLKKPRSDTMTLWRSEVHDNPTAVYLPTESLEILEGDKQPESLGSRLRSQRKQQAEDLEKEQLRLLYVAMTRARDRLVMLAPEEDASSPHYAQTWSQQLKQTAQKHKWHIPIIPHKNAEKAEKAKLPEKTKKAEKAEAKPSVASVDSLTFASATARAPSFLFVPPVAEPPLQPPRTASRHKGSADEPHEQRELRDRKRDRKLDQRQRGILLHRLVRELVEERQGARDEQARKLLRQALQPFALEEGERLSLVEDWAAKALRLLEHPLFSDKQRAPLFEVELAGKLPQGNFVGRVDLLWENATTRLFGDLKSDASVAPQLPTDYASQFGVYRALLEALAPKKRVEGYVLWFETGEIRRLAAEDMPQPLPPPETTPSFSP